MFLSERTVSSPAAFLVDFATEYHGLGHYFVHSYDFRDGRVLKCMDGGSSESARIRNTKERKKILSQYVSNPLGTLPLGVQAYSTFEEWFVDRTNMLDGHL